MPCFMPKINLACIATGVFYERWAGPLKGICTLFWHRLFYKCGGTLMEACCPRISPMHCGYNKQCCINVLACQQGGSWAPECHVRRNTLPAHAAAVLPHSVGIQRTPIHNNKFKTIIPTAKTGPGFILLNACFVVAAIFAWRSARGLSFPHAGFLIK